MITVALSAKIELLLIKGEIPMRFISVAFVSFILASTVPSLASETVKEPVPVKTLAVCSALPNCVSSLATNRAHRLPPFRFTGPVEAAQERLIRVIRQIPRSEIVKEEPGYLVVIFRSKILGLVDEAEFAFDEKEGDINIHSEARIGFYDFGANRSRLEEIRESFLENEEIKSASRGR
jgi:uncharacterized protein (DUF1499 family)